MIVPLTVKEVRPHWVSVTAFHSCSLLMYYFTIFVVSDFFCLAT